MNQHLRGDVRVKGVSIEEFIEKIVSKTLTSDVKPSTIQNDSMNVEEIINKKMEPLEAFQDEKRVMTDALAQLVDRVAKLESSPPLNVAEIDDLAKSMDKLEKKVADMKPKRGVDQNTLDSALADAQQKMESKIQAVSDALTELRKELEEP